MRYGDLRDSRPEDWYTLADELGVWRDRARDCAVDLRNRLVVPLMDEGVNQVWAGHAQQGAAARIGEVSTRASLTADELGAAADGARAFGDRLVDLQSRVAEPVGRAAGRGWVVHDDGTLTVPEGWVDPLTGADGEEPHVVAEAQGIVDDIRRFVAEAGAADAHLAGLLTVTG